MNDIRIRGYEKAFEECNKRSLANQEFNLPDIAINESSVYSRLYNNIIVKNKTRNYNNKSQGFSESIYRDEKNNINTHSSSLMRHNAKRNKHFIYQILIKIWMEKNSQKK